MIAPFAPSSRHHPTKLSATARAEPPLKTHLATMIGNNRRPNA
jgi:hypothetical protein